MKWDGNGMKWKEEGDSVGWAVIDGMGCSGRWKGI